MTQLKKSNLKLGHNPQIGMNPSPYVFEAIGTRWTIEIYDTLSGSQKDTILSKVKKRIDSFDKTYSRFLPNSEVTKMSSKKGDYILPDDAEKMIDFYKRLYDLTDHTVTPLIGNALSDAGYDANYSLIPKKITPPPSWNESIDYHYPVLKIKKPVLLDFGAAGKGYIIDIIGNLLITNKVNNFCIDAGGDFLHKSNKNKTIKIGLENPLDTTQIIGTADISSQSLCASAGNRRRWDNFHHIINPHTLTSPSHILATWVVAESALTADGIATALFFKKATFLRLHFDFEYLIVFNDQTYELSSNFPGELYTNTVAEK